MVVLVADYPDHDILFQRGFWPMQMPDGQDYVSLKCISVTRMQSSTEAVSSTLLQSFSPEFNPDSVLSLAKKVQDEKFPWLMQELASDGYATSIKWTESRTQTCSPSALRPAISGTT